MFINRQIIILKRFQQTQKTSFPINEIQRYPLKTKNPQKK